MQQQLCSTNCTVEFLSELSLCTHQDCHQPLLRCKSCFRNVHASPDEFGKLRTHTHVPFDESPVFKNFLYFVKLYELIVSKFTKSFGPVNKNTEYICWQIFSTSSFAKSFESQLVLADFYVLKELYYNRPGMFAASPSSELIESFNMFSEKMFNTARNSLLQPTEEEDHLAYYFNQASDSNPQALELFISREQQAFVQYCESAQENNTQFNIREYLKKRKLVPGVNLSYFTRMFELFLEEKYEEKAEEKDIFTAQQYLAYAYENLHSFCEVQQTSAYLDTWVQNYNQFSQYMTTKNLQPTLLAFRMWKNHVPVDPTTKSHQKDKYFLDNFIFVYVEYLINSSLFTVTSSKDPQKSWKDFIRYLKDYVGACKLKGDQAVDISKYSTYFQFRQKSQQMITHLQKSTQISFNRQICIEYLNTAFNQGTMITKKNYIKYLNTKTQENLKKQQQFVDICTKLQSEIKAEEGTQFYQIVFNDYVKVCVGDKAVPNKEEFFQFKKSVLEKFDEEQIRLQNDRFLIQGTQEETRERQEDEEKPVNKSENAKVQHNINEEEQQLANEINDDDQVGEICKCCNGQPQDCKKPECEMIGYCVVCSL